MEDIRGLLLFAVIWFVVGLIGRAGRKKQDTRPPQPPRGRRPVSETAGTDPTQQEGSRLELVLRQVQRALEETGQQATPPRLPKPRYRDTDDARSLEVEPEVASLETEVFRKSRRRVDQDDEAEEIEARRIKAAAARDAARSPVDHTAFDERIRKEPAEHTATPGYTAKQLRDAMIWREILDPPVSLRRESDPDR